MDTLLATWEMNVTLEQSSDVREEIANWPAEPYTINWDNLNWN